MGVAALAALAGIVALWVILKLAYFGNRVDRRARRLARMQRHEVTETFEAARRTVISQLRSPRGRAGQAEADAALEFAVACLDRLDELDGKDCGTANKAKIRRLLEVRLRKEADYWLQDESGIDFLGREQEPSVFAAQRELGPFPR